MQVFIEPIGRLINEFTKLPGVGRKTAQRYAYKIINMTSGEVDDFIQALKDAKTKVKYCKICGNYSEEDFCEICKLRDSSQICVVKEPKDVIALEKLHEYKGVYHVLHGVIDPVNNVSPDDLKIKELVTRVAQGDVKEVIMATNPDVSGEATALYLAKILKPFGVTVTRLAHGIPIGSELEYTDEVTLARAFVERKSI